MEFRREINEEFAAALRMFLDENYPQEMRSKRFEWPFDWNFHRKFAAWQNEHLAHAGAAEDNAFIEELDRADVEIRTTLTTGLVANILRAAGTDDQKGHLVPDIINGDVIAVLGYTEPDSGSDVASAKTSAVWKDNSWVINGQKMFTSNAEIATHVFLLTRTNTEVPKHSGLTTFILPMNTPGIEIREIKTLGGHSTTMTFYTDVRVPDSCRVGDIDGGWAVMRVGLDYEHSAGAQHGDSFRMMGRSPALTAYGFRLDSVLRRTIEWSRKAKRDDGTYVIDDQTVRERLAKAAIEVEVSRLLGFRNDDLSKGPGVGNGTKLFASEAYVRATEDLIDIAGPAGVMQYTEDGAVAAGWMEWAFRESQVSLIAGGCCEVQRDIIAERRLGLARMKPGIRS